MTAPSTTSSGRGRVAQLVGGAVAGAGALVATGVLIDRHLAVRRLERRGITSDHVPLGSLRGEAHTLLAGDGIALHAEVDEVAPYSGDGDVTPGLTLVFVHGFALTLDCWHFQRAAFRGRHRMVFFDQRSHGRSARSDKEHATIDQLGRDLATVLDALAPTGRVVLVGHSMGGMAVVALAEQRPELFGDRVGGVALISTAAGGTRTYKVVNRYIPDALGRRLVARGLSFAAQRDRVLELVRKGGAPVSLRFIDGFGFGDGHVPPDYVEFVDEMISATPVQVLVEFLPQFDALDKFHVLAALSRVPTWVMSGTKDKLTSIEQAHRLHEAIAGSRLVELQGDGHLPIMESAVLVNEALEELVAEAAR